VISFDLTIKDVHFIKCCRHTDLLLNGTSLYDHASFPVFPIQLLGNDITTEEEKTKNNVVKHCCLDKNDILEDFEARELKKDRVGRTVRG